jgi:RNA polymerase sigma factor (sigma-70 family)
VESFDDVLIAARAGADWAWERIYADLAPTVVGYLRARGAAEPEDLAGEAFLHVVRGLERFSGDERDFRAWVFTIVHRRLQDERRRRGRRPAVAVPPEEAAERAGAGGDVEREALDRLGERRAREAIERLPEDQRTVLLLRILGDLTVEEVARAVGKRPGAVKALQRRALRRIEREGLI